MVDSEALRQDARPYQLLGCLHVDMGAVRC
jgi:hypothetical protein